MEVAIMPSMAGRATDGGDGGWLQDVATFIIFIFPSLTLVTVGLRIYARLGKKQFGLGMSEALAARKVITSTAD